jgi:heme/copper-type cytochrome/quinol oxidase subunit 4
MNWFIWKFERNSILLALVVLSILGGLLTIARGYAYGTGNQIEQLPLILRAANPKWLSNDFFTNMASAPGPRMFYSLFIAQLLRFVPLEVIFLLLTFLCNTITILLSGLLARDLFGDTAGLIMILLISTIGSPIRLGGAAYLTDSNLTPQLLVMPFIVGAVWAITRYKFELCAMLSMLAAVFHPLLGLETGAILLLAAPMVLLVSRLRISVSNDRLLSWTKWLSSAFALVGMTWFWHKIAFTTHPLDSAQFVEIVAYFRHPHHYVPSTFPLRDYLELFLFLVSVTIVAYWTVSRRFLSSNITILLLLVSICLVILSCIFGFIFVELLPSRFWVTAQPFRLLYLVNLIGMTLIAGGISKFLNNKDLQEHYDALVLILSMYAPALAGFVFGLKACKPVVSRWLGLSPSVYTALMTVPIMVYWASQPKLAIHFALMYVSFLVSYSLLQNRAGQILWISWQFLCIMLVFLGFFYPANPLSRITGKIAAKPILSLSDIKGPMAEVARFARANTPPSSVFLTPPDWGQFRLLAERAIVVDFKAFPFQDAAMLEWRQRLLDCYGRTKATGFSAIPEMTINYKHITDDAIITLQAKYGFAYAVLYAETKTSLPVLFTTDNFKVVEVVSLSR